MPKLSGLTTDGEATVPLGDLAPFTEEQLLARAHRVHVLFACMDCKKSWVELREMLRHMVEGGCLGEAGKDKPSQSGTGQTITTVVDDVKRDDDATPQKLVASSAAATRGRQRMNAVKDAVAKVLVRPRPAAAAAATLASPEAVDVVTPETGSVRRSSRLSSGAIKAKGALALLGMKTGDAGNEDMESSQDEASETESPKRAKRALVHEIVLPEATPARPHSSSAVSTPSDAKRRKLNPVEEREMPQPQTDVTISIEVSGEGDKAAGESAEETLTVATSADEGEEQGQEPGDADDNERCDVEMFSVQEEGQVEEQNPQTRKLRAFGHLFPQRAGAPAVRRSEKAFRCHTCKARFFETEVEMDVHHACHVEDSDGFKCCVCGHPGRTWNSLLPHLLTHDDMKEKLRDTDMVTNIYGSFRCTLCKKVFDKLANLKLHISKVHFKQPSTCTVCGETFHTDEKTFKRHRDKCANITYQCEHCKYSTLVQDNMTKHMKVHTGKGFPCDACPKVFPTRQRRDIHALKHNPNRTKHVCEVCAHEFCSQDAVKKHILRMHSGLEAKYKCEVVGCQFTCKIPLDLRKHNVYVHQKKFKCLYCDYQSNSKTAMDGHKAYHNPGRKFACHHDQCFYRGVSMKQLSNHISQVHRLTTKHQCPICQRWYKKKTHLARHLVSHTGDKPYSCLECGESYATHSAYYRHRNTTGHDAKREGIVSVPQNITIKYITEDGEGGGEGGAEDDGEDDDGGGEDGAAETLYMTQEQQNAIHSLISIPQQHGSGGGGGVPMQEGEAEVVQHVVEHVSDDGGAPDEQTIYLDSEGRGTATAVVDGKEVTYVLHVGEDGQYHVETTDAEGATVIETVTTTQHGDVIETVTTQDGDVIETVTAEGGEAVEEGAMETRTIVMEGDEPVTDEQLEQIKEVIFQSDSGSGGETVVEIAPAGGSSGGGGDAQQQYAILMVPPEGEPASEAALSMLQLQSSGAQ